MTHQFKTPDPSLGGYLISQGFGPEALEWSGAQLSFVFGLTDPLKQAVEGFTFNTLAPVRDVIGGYRRALGLIREARNSKSNNPPIQGVHTNDNCSAPR